MQESNVLIIDGIPEPIILKRSKRTSLSVSVLLNGTVKISAPLKLSLKKIEGFIGDRKDWINCHLETAKNKVDIAEKFLSLDSFILAGKEYDICRASIKKPNLTEKTLYLPIAKSICIKNSSLEDNLTDFSENKKDYAQQNIIDKKLLKDFIKSTSLKNLGLMLYDLSQKTHIEYCDFKLTDSTKCWGMCTANKTIKLNLRLCVLPIRLQNYVIIHELCHIKELNHSPKFWELVKSFEPNYKELKAELKRYSAFINLYR